MAQVPPILSMVHFGSSCVPEGTPVTAAGRACDPADAPETCVNPKTTVPASASPASPASRLVLSTVVSPFPSVVDHISFRHSGCRRSPIGVCKGARYQQLTSNNVPSNPPCSDAGADHRLRVFFGQGASTQRLWTERARNITSATEPSGTNEGRHETESERHCGSRPPGATSWNAQSNGSLPVAPGWVPSRRKMS
jgi:hypothetical protein